MEINSGRSNSLRMQRVHSCHFRHRCLAGGILRFRSSWRQQRITSIFSEESHFRALNALRRQSGRSTHCSRILAQMRTGRHRSSAGLRLGKRRKPCNISILLGRSSRVQRHWLRGQGRLVLVQINRISMRSKRSRHDGGRGRFVAPFGRHAGDRQRPSGLTTSLFPLSVSNNVLEILLARVNASLEVIFDL